MDCPGAWEKTRRCSDEFARTASCGRTRCSAARARIRRIRARALESRPLQHRGARRSSTILAVSPCSLPAAPRSGVRSPPAGSDHAPLAAAARCRASVSRRAPRTDNYESGGVAQNANAFRRRLNPTRGGRQFLACGRTFALRQASRRPRDPVTRWQAGGLSPGGVPGAASCGRP